MDQDPSPTPLLTDRLLLTGWRDEHAEPFAQLNADPRVMEFMPKILSRQESDAIIDRIRSHIAQHGFGLWAVELRDNGHFIGFVGLSIPAFQARFTPCVEVGWRLAYEAWGKGYATEGASAALRFGFQDLNLESIVSFTTIENTRSRRVMERLGMKHDPAEDFLHPNLPEGHPLSQHVLYGISQSEWLKSVTEC
jgi:RimJ/RimL family protein N-acetyltransferase